MATSDNLEDAHNQGEQDAPTTYDPPHTIIPILDDILYPAIKEDMEKENEAYNKGWSNTYKQS